MELIVLALVVIVFAALVIPEATKALNRKRAEETLDETPSDLLRHVIAAGGQPSTNPIADTSVDVRFGEG